MCIVVYYHYYYNSNCQNIHFLFETFPVHIGSSYYGIINYLHFSILFNNQNQTFNNHNWTEYCRF